MMKIQLKNGTVASEQAKASLTSRLGCRLSSSFADFISTMDGAEPETNIFKISDSLESGVNRFIPVAEIEQERAQIENIPDKAYPVAWAEGGNYVFINEDKNGAVFFWDHEAPETLTKLADNFGAFLDLLEPFDVKKVKLKPGQVKRAWIDPDFLKRIKK